MKMHRFVLEYLNTWKSKPIAALKALHLFFEKRGLPLGSTPKSVKPLKLDFAKEVEKSCEYTSVLLVL